MCVVLAGWLAAPAAGATPAISNLGTLGGGYSYGFAINPSGQVAGYSTTTNSVVLHAFLYTGTPGSGGSMADLGALSGRPYSEGHALNASGQVAGIGYQTGFAGLRAFLYTGTPGSGGAMADLGTLGGTKSWAYGVNDAGQVAGSSETTGNAARHAVRWTRTTPNAPTGSMADLGTLGGSFSDATAINGSGQVAGVSFMTGDAVQHAFLYTDTPGSGGAMADLGTLGNSWSGATAVNGSGQVTGSSSPPGGVGYHAFLYSGTPGSGGAMVDLGTLGGSTSQGDAINSYGEVVGYSFTTGNAANHPFFYTGTPGAGGHMIDLETWLDANNPTEGAKWTLSYAQGLTDTRLITGYGEYNDGPGGLSDGTRAFLLDASSLVPEPGTMSIVVMGALLCLPRRRL